MYIEMSKSANSHDQHFSDKKLPSNTNNHEQEPSQKHDLSGDLSVTALYTAGVWHWAGFKYSELLSSIESERVFKVTNFALGVMRLFRWNLPRLPQGLAQRHQLIDQLSQESQAHTIIELASGLSTRALRLSHAPKLSSLQQYIEIDLPHVIAHKRECLEQQDQLSSIVKFLSQDLKRFKADEFQENVTLSEPITMIAEGLVMYLTAEELKVLFTELSILLQSHSGRLIFDWVPSIEEPPPGLIGKGLGYLMKLFTGGDSFERDQRSRDDMKALLYDLGAHNVTLYDTHLVAQSRHLPFAHAKTQQLIFCADF